MKTTKKALFSSVIALFLCFSMLLGTTFAWFTDSVTSSGNIIQSGTLDVTMEWADGTKAVPAIDSAEWTDASAGAIFNSKLWEPGYVEVRHIKIANEGTLALKYKVSVIPNGEASDITDAIDVYYLDPASQIADRTALTEDKKLGTLTDVLANLGSTAAGELLAGETDTVTLALKMRETAGNEYQDKSVGDGFIIQLIATQLAYEEDSFDDQYDAEATFLNKDADGAWLINNLDELYFFAQDVNSGNSYYGETVKLTADIDLSGYAWTPIGSGDVNGTWIGFNGEFDGQGHTVSNMKVTKGGGWNGFFGLVGRNSTGFTDSISNLTVKNAVINGASRMTGAIVGQMYGNIENCHVEDVTITAIPNAVASGYDNGDKIGGIVGWHGDNGNNHYIKGCTAKNVSLKAYRDVAGIAGYIGQSSIVEDCAVDTVSITVDQVTNYYGDKDANAGGVVGRIYNQPVTVQNNTEANVSVVFVWDGKVPTSKPDTLVVDTVAKTISINDDAAFAYLNTLLDNDTFYNEYGSTWQYSIELNVGVDLNNNEWTPIVMKDFVGFDGNGNTISGLKVTSGNDRVGLFASVGGIDLPSTYVKDLTLDGAYVKGGIYTGALVGYATCTVEGVSVLNATVEGGKYTGGLAGRVSSIIGCSVSKSEVSASDKTVGGLVGYCIGDPGVGEATGNTVDGVSVIGAYNVGGMFGQAQNENVNGNTVKNTSVTSTKALPANASSNEVCTHELAARHEFAGTTIGTNTVENVTMEVRAVSNLSDIDDLIDDGVKVIDVGGANLGDFYYDAKFTDGVTVKNAEFSYFYGGNVEGTVVFENCKFISDHSYCANFDSGNGNIIFNNCEFDGWASFGDAIQGVEMNNCTFRKTYNYGVLRFYQDAKLNGCVFEASFEGIDTNETGTKVEFVNCTGIDGKIFNNGSNVGIWIVDGVDISSTVTSW